LRALLDSEGALDYREVTHRMIDLSFFAQTSVPRQ
jgi:hypothetical protein